MPTKTETDTLFKNLATNGLDFLMRSTKDLAEGQIKFSVVNFAAGAELLLKARLFSEHWSLVAANPRQTNWTQINDGTFISVMASDLVGAVSTVTTTTMQTESEIFRKIFDHRNKVVHFVPSPKIEEVVSEQFRAWHYLIKLLRIKWKDHFSVVDIQIGQIDDLLMANAKYLVVRFEELQKEPTYQKAFGQGRVASCPSCGNNAVEVVETTTSVSDARCLVCLFETQIANFKCGKWHIFPDDVSQQVACSCGKSHSIDELKMPNSTHGDWDEDHSDEFSCGQCDSLDTVIITGPDTLRCYSCGDKFTESDISTCEYCQRPWVGSTEDLDYYTGCSECGGRAESLRDDDDSD